MCDNYFQRLKEKCQKAKHNLDVASHQLTPKQRNQIFLKSYRKYENYNLPLTYQDEEINRLRKEK